MIRLDIPVVHLVYSLNGTKQKLKLNGTESRYSELVFQKKIVLMSDSQLNYKKNNIWLSLLEINSDEVLLNSNSIISGTIN